MSLNRNKTARRSLNESNEASVDFAVNESLQRMIETEADSAYKKPWHRLERGLRLNRIRAFTEEMATLRSLKQTEKVALQTLLIKALDKKLLNSKTAVEYDPEEEKIKEIKSLVMHQNAAGEVLFQLLEKRNAVTFRKRGSGAASQASDAPATASAVEDGDKA